MWKQTPRFFGVTLSSDTLFRTVSDSLTLMSSAALVTPYYLTTDHFSNYFHTLILNCWRCIRLSAVLNLAYFLYISHTCLFLLSCQWRHFNKCFQCHFPAISSNFISFETSCRPLPPQRLWAWCSRQQAHMTFFQFTLQRPVWYVLSCYITSSAPPSSHT